MVRVVVLGSTGSIGRSAMDVIRMHPDRFTVAGLSAGSNAGLLLSQADEFEVDLLSLTSAGSGWEVPFTGENAALEVIRRASPDFVVNGISGAAGFLPSLEAIRSGAVLALANKESLVIGGHFLTREAEKAGLPIIPVDSEHSAVFQCLRGESASDIRRVILTASGGPFRKRPADTFKDITPEEALSHPTWSMGRRITIDSATMMNKGLEIIEACWLFPVPLEKIEVAVHPQSIVHSMVEFRDKSIKAQLSVPDMRAAIAYALSCPDRLNLALVPLDFTAGLNLEFFPPDARKFPALALARSAMDRPEVLPCIMNAADEIAINAFLSGRIGFTRITDVVKKTMDILSGSTVDSPEEVMELDKKARKIAEANVE
jgi:1-deoxy-D-xylulose-5-phosphate reductoisomerase